MHIFCNIIQLDIHIHIYIYLYIINIYIYIVYIDLYSVYNAPVSMFVWIFSHLKFHS